MRLQVNMKLSILAEKEWKSPAHWFWLSDYEDQDIYQGGHQYLWLACLDDKFLQDLEENAIDKNVPSYARSFF